MSYTRDPDHYTRGVGAVQAVDKVLASRRGRALRQRDAAIESRRRDALKAKLMRPGMGMVPTATRSVMSALGMVKLPTFGRTGSNMAPVVTAGGLVEGGGTIGGGGAVNTGGTFGSGGGGGGVSPTNGGGVRGRTFTLALNAANTGKMGPMSPPPYVGICVDARGNKIPCPAPASGGGPAWNPNSGIVPPVYVPPGKSPPDSGPGGPASTTDPGTSPTSTVGTSTGGSSGGGAGASSGGGGVIDSGPGVDDGTDPVVITPSAPDYQKYAIYGGVALLAYLVLKGR